MQCRLQENAFGKSSPVRFRKLGMAPKSGTLLRLKLNEVLVTTAPEGHIKVKLGANRKRKSETGIRGFEQKMTL